MVVLQGTATEVVSKLVRKNILQAKIISILIDEKSLFEPIWKSIKMIGVTRYLLKAPKANKPVTNKIFANRIFP